MSHEDTTDLVPATPPDQPTKLEKKLSTIARSTKLKIITVLKEKIDQNEKDKAANKLEPENDVEARFAKVIFEANHVCEFDSVLFHLNAAYHSHKKLDDLSDDEETSSTIENAINQYIIERGFKFFCGLLNNAGKIDEVPNTLLTALAQELGIHIDHDPVVEAEIKEGKVYWKLVNPKTEAVLYDRQISRGRAEFKYTKANCWRMTWEKFREFKNSGKRTGTTSITFELFKRYSAGTVNETKAKEIWDELHTKGILNKNDRLSLEWHHFTAETLTFMSFNNPNQIIKILYAILDKETTAETLPNLPHCEIYRPDVSRKKCARTGSITNTKDTPPARLWDVSAWGLFNTLKTMHEANNTGLDFDHIPSKSTFRTHASSLLTAEQNATVKECNDEIDELTKKKAAMKKEDPEKANLAKQIKDKTEQHKANFPLLAEGMPRNGDHWLTVVVTKSLHKAGNSHSESATAQAANADNEHPFISDASFYLKALHDVPEKYDIPPNDFHKAAGALRYLYKRQKAQPQLVGGKKTLGHNPHHFFKSREAENPKIDEMFNNAMRRYEDETKNPPNRKGIISARKK